MSPGGLPSDSRSQTYGLPSGSKKGGSPAPLLIPPRAGRWPCSRLALCSPLPARRFGRPRLRGPGPPGPAGAVATRSAPHGGFLYVNALVSAGGNGPGPRPGRVACTRPACRCRTGPAPRPRRVGRPIGGRPARGPRISAGQEYVQRRPSTTEKWPDSFLPLRPPSGHFSLSIGRRFPFRFYGGRGWGSLPCLRAPLAYMVAPPPCPR